MASRHSALASLTATYTDSENEDDRRSDEDADTDASNDSQVIIPQQPQRTVVPQSAPPAVSSANVSPRTKKTLRLVSYNDDTYVSDDEQTSPVRTHTVMDISDEEHDKLLHANERRRDEDDEERQKKFGTTLPPEPKGKCPPELQEKIQNLYEKMKTSNRDMNKIIQERKEFRNPSIYEKLIQFCDINELGTNYPPEIYDPLQWSKESFFEELAKAQKVEMDKREKERKETTKAELVAAAAKKTEEEIKKRKSKWDQPGPSVTVSANPHIKPACLLQPALTANVTGTKGTVISAFGSLPKKPKV